jgi:hypothetical protein
MDVGWYFFQAHQTANCCWFVWNITASVCKTYQQTNIEELPIVLS